MTDYDGTTQYVMKISFPHSDRMPLNGLTYSSMSEETHDAAIRGPFAIRFAIIVSGVMGAALTITFCFCITDLDEILSSPTGLPAAQIILNAGGQTGGTIMWVFVILVQGFTGCSAMLADTRMAYAFARDEAFPLSRYVSTLHPLSRWQRSFSTNRESGKCQLGQRGSCHDTNFS